MHPETMVQARGVRARQTTLLLHGVDVVPPQPRVVASSTKSARSRAASAAGRRRHPRPERRPPERMPKRWWLGTLILLGMTAGFGAAFWAAFKLLR